MRDSPPRCVVDSNVFIDFHEGGLLKAMFELPFTFSALDVVLDELHRPDREHLLAMELESISASAHQVEAVVALAGIHRRPSINDLFVFVIARAERATLVTGDRALRHLAKPKGMAVHGTLRLLDHLVRQTIVTPQRATEGLKSMLEDGRRLPDKECRERIQRWGRS